MSWRSASPERASFTQRDDARRRVCCRFATWLGRVCPTCSDAWPIRAQERCERWLQTRKRSEETKAVYLIASLGLAHQNTQPDRVPWRIFLLFYGVVAASVMGLYRVYSRNVFDWTVSRTARQLHAALLSLNVGRTFVYSLHMQTQTINVSA